MWTSDVVVMPGAGESSLMASLLLLDLCLLDCHSMFNQFRFNVVVTQ